MRKVIVFNFITLNGFFEGPIQGDISWHKHGEEESEYSNEMLKTGNTLIFGRRTYQMMESYWPTPLALQNDPDTAKRMNEAEKLVFSRTLKKAEWNNTRILRGSIEEEIKKLKKIPGKDLAVLGSGTIVTRLAEADLIDEYQIMLDPVIISHGTSILKGIRKKLNLKLISTRSFTSGVVLLSYQPTTR